MCILEPRLKDEDEFLQQLRDYVNGSDTPGAYEIDEWARENGLEEGTGGMEPPKPPPGQPPGGNNDPPGGDDDDGMSDEQRVAKTLHEVETSLKDIVDHEEAVVVGRDGKIIHTEKGKQYSVKVSVEFIENNIVTHNHPDGKCTLFADDVIEIISNGGYEVRTVTKDGRFVSLKEGMGKLDNTIGEAMRKEGFGAGDPRGLFYKAYDRAVEKFGRSNIKHWHIQKEVEELVNEWLNKNASIYGYIFTKGDI
jgi:hypothetical protein